MRTRELVGAALFAVLTALGALLTIPLVPVPITLQTFFTYLAGGILGARAGALSQLIYVLLGVIGLPIFAGGASGPGVFAGPTGGYLVGFIFGAYAVGLMTRRAYTYGRLLLGMTAATGVIYAFGATYLAAWLASPLNPTAVADPIGIAVTFGVLPFLVGDALKIVVAAGIASRKPIAQARARYFVTPPVSSP